MPQQAKAWREAEKQLPPGPRDRTAHRLRYDTSELLRVSSDADIASFDNNNEQQHRINAVLSRSDQNRSLCFSSSHRPPHPPPPLRTNTHRKVQQNPSSLTKTRKLTSHGAGQGHAATQRWQLLGLVKVHSTQLHPLTQCNSSTDLTIDETLGPQQTVTRPPLAGMVVVMTTAPQDQARSKQQQR